MRCLRLFATLIFASSLALVPLLGQPPRVEPSPELERLHFQLGTWKVTAKSFDRAGNLVRTRENRALVTLRHNGLLIHHLEYDKRPEDSVYRIWQFWDRYDGTLHDVSYDVVGHFEHRVAVDNDGQLAFEFPASRAFQDGVPRNWRKTYSEIEPDSYRMVWEYTEDEGKTWILIFDSLFERIASDDHSGG